MIVASVGAACAGVRERAGEPRSTCRDCGGPFSLSVAGQRFLLGEASARPAQRGMGASNFIVGSAIKSPRSLRQLLRPKLLVGGACLALIALCSAPVLYNIPGLREGPPPPGGGATPRRPPKSIMLL